MSANQLAISAASTGHVIRDSYTSGTLQLAHSGSAHNAVFVMDRTSGQLVVERCGEQLFRNDIMQLTALVAATPDLRFTELVNLLVT